MTNNTFDIRRLGRCLYYDLKNLKANYLLTMLVISMMPVFLYVTVLFFSLVAGSGWTVPPEEVRILMMFVPFVVLILTAPSKLYGHITAKRSGSDYLMLPASTLEKFISMLVIILVVVPILTSVGFFASDALLSLLGHDYGKPLIAMDLAQRIGFPFISTVGSSTNFALFRALYTSFCNTTLFFLLGALLFSRAKVVLTALCMMGFGSILSSIIMIITINTDFALADLTVDHPAMFRALSAVYFVLQSGTWMALIYLRLKKIKH